MNSSLRSSVFEARRYQRTRASFFLADFWSQRRINLPRDFTIYLSITPQTQSLHTQTSGTDPDLPFNLLILVLRIGHNDISVGSSMHLLLHCGGSFAVEKKVHRVVGLKWASPIFNPLELWWDGEVEREANIIVGSSFRPLWGATYICRGLLPVDRDDLELIARAFSELFVLSMFPSSW